MSGLISSTWGHSFDVASLVRKLFSLACIKVLFF
jgi:hypothetical protein